jgi:hypothetical protein
MGCSHDSNCAASVRYMKTNDRPNANKKLAVARPVSFDRPCGKAWYDAGMCRLVMSSSSTFWTSLSP